MLLSLTAYCNFEKTDIGKNLYEIFKEKGSYIIIDGNSLVLRRSSLEVFLKFFEKNLKEWTLYLVENKTSTSGILRSSGFYAAVFKKSDQYVIAYRGSENYPKQDAYKDFIETDLLIGVGKRPQQFWEGVDVLKKLMKTAEVTPENISLTGHSLGGGIAQFAAVIADKEFGIHPFTCTWNSVGINRDGIISVEDFIDYPSILERLDLQTREKEIFSNFKNDYLSFLLKELKGMGIIRDNKTVLVEEESNITFHVDEEFISRLFKNSRLEEYLLKIPLERRKELLLEKKFLESLFDIDALGSQLIKAKSFIKKTKENSSYERKVLNFCHSQDLTNSMFKHVGCVYQVDLNFLKRDMSSEIISKKLNVFKKSLKEYHFEDVFLPFIELEGEREGKFEKKLNCEFIASSIRKLIDSRSFEKKFMAFYYELAEADSGNFRYLKSQIVEAFKKSQEEYLYKKQIIEQLNSMELDQFQEVWRRTKNKLASPYRARDVFDIIVFKD